jgi:hypothetical protein
VSEDALWEDGGSIFRPSYSATWLNCLGALQPSRWAPDTAGIDAAIGTVFHSLIAEWQMAGRPDHWLGSVIEITNEAATKTFQVEVDEEMFYHGENCLRYYEDIPGDRFIETKVDISDITPIPNQKGTADLAICSMFVLDIVDWKYGKGVQVWAEKNTQELLYAWGFFKLYDHIYHFRTIRLHIAQPRFNHFDVWEITREELIGWADWMRERAHAAWKRGAPRTPGPKQCQWCKVTGGCSALEIRLAEIADQTFDDGDITEEQMTTSIALNAPLAPKGLPDPMMLPTANLAKIRDYRKLFEAYFKACDEELLHRLIGGETADGWKVVDGRTRRRYRNEKRAVEKYKLVGLTEDEIFVKKIVSPAQAEKLLRSIGIGGKLMKDFLGMLTENPKGKPTLAPDGDNRLSVPNVIDGVFDTEDQAEDEI